MGRRLLTAGIGTIFQLQHTGWTAREGAPGSINSLAQTTDGYLWLGTSSGLFRFDGVHFDRYKLPSGEKLNSDDIFSLMATSDGGLWIGFHYGNVAFMKDGRIISYGESEGLPSGTVTRFIVDREGAVWAAVGGGIARLEGTRWQRIGEDWAYPGKYRKDGVHGSRRNALGGQRRHRSFSPARSTSLPENRRARRGRSSTYRPSAGWDLVDGRNRQCSSEADHYTRERKQPMVPDPCETV